jgi:hypothetical protein
MMAQLAEAGKLTLDDVRELETTLKKLELEQKAERTREAQMLWELRNHVWQSAVFAMVAALATGGDRC